jgi:hypothetical protein
VGGERGEEGTKSEQDYGMLKSHKGHPRNSRRNEMVNYLKKIKSEELDISHQKEKSLA